MIRVEYDDHKVRLDEINKLCEAAKEIVSQATGIKDVFVYANSSQIRVNVAPIEVFVEMSASKAENKQELFDRIMAGLSAWKQQTAFRPPINLTLIPTDWIFKVDI